MEALADSLGASPKYILWDAIAKASESARPPYWEVSGFFEEETKSNRCCVERLLDFRDYESPPATWPERCSPILGAPSTTSVPNIIADMVAIAQLKQCPPHLMFPASCGGTYWSGKNAESIVGSEDLISAQVNASSRYIHVRLQGMKLNHRYFVSFNMQLCGDTSDPDHDVASYVVPQPNLLDGLGWTNSPLSLDLTVLHEKNPLGPVCTNAEDCGDARYKITVRILQLSDDFWPAGVKPVLITLKEGPLVDILSARQQRTKRPEVFPFGMQDVTCPSDHPVVSDMSFIPYSFSSLDSRNRYQWPEEACMPVTRVVDSSRDFVQGSTPQFRTHESSQSELFENFVRASFLSAAASSNDHVAVDRGRTNFFRDLDGEALLRQLHLRQRHPPATPPGESHCQQCCGSLCDGGHHAMLDDMGIFEENYLNGRYACPSADAIFL